MLKKKKKRFLKINGTWQKGWLFDSKIRRYGSPNFNLRPKNTRIDLIVIHFISVPENNFNAQNIRHFFQNRLKINEQNKNVAFLEVSAHFYIARSGQIFQFVSIFNRAWHAGKSAYKGRENCNNYSIGIELAGNDLMPFTEKQYFALNELLKNIQKTIGTFEITGHSNIAPTRKTDPGKFFNYQKLNFPR